MSSVVWDGDNLLQRVGNNIEELGHVKYEENSNEFVLWLKDTRGVFGNKNGYIRGDSFLSMRDAKQNAAFTTSASLFHHMWMVGLRDDGKEAEKDVAQAIEDAESGQPVTVSTFKEEMAKMTEKLDSSEKKARRYFVVGVVIGAIGLVIGAAGVVVGIIGL